ncbi:hypothetical protein NDU88_001597 [Pleurodeles waltl]|uniref:Uncharacterized protein n=1 Tax=Pleurodeles waltl TaxID=8319 RepID=A0AAV7MM63_PLEWA|nr:hypothetical protein NDU88_001597 [Pleurodeles waltl]
MDPPGQGSLSLRTPAWAPSTARQRRQAGAAAVVSAPAARSYPSPRQPPLCMALQGSPRCADSPRRLSQPSPSGHLQGKAGDEKGRWLRPRGAHVPHKAGAGCPGPSGAGGSRGGR